MKLLAIETATEACSAALYLDGRLGERFAVSPRGHSALILEMMDELLRSAGIGLGDLDALAFGRGPGSFTGVRIATGVIQGVGFATGLPVVPVSTLAALAQRYHRERGAEKLLPAFDARMHEVYWGVYVAGEDGLVVPLVPDEVAAPQRVSLPPGDGWCGIGSGWSAYGPALRARLGRALARVEPELLCSAQDVALLGVAGYREGRAVPAEQALPVYLRDRVTATPAS